jgi:Ca2+-binding RTX toxin-like protein
MAHGQINRLLEFANMQMAAEAFLSQIGDDIPNLPPAGQVRARLVAGNFHASKFMPVQAQQFVDTYEVLAQYRNDPLLPSGSGFSGTLFKHKATGELTLSFRSVEFIDDAVRDSKATGRREIKDLGWAFGQIAEMEAWYGELRSDPNLLGGGKTFNVTGYSLGGHLATAFNILRREAFENTGDPDANPIINTYTFNGAGIGEILDGRSLTALVADFNRIRADYVVSREWTALSPGDQNAVRAQAQSRIDEIVDERVRVARLSGVTRAFSTSAPAGEQLSLGYQIAALLVGQNTRGASNFPLLGGTNDIPTAPVFASELGLQGFSTMVEIVGSDGGNLGPSFVANSGIHYGSRQEIYIEDQPLARGTYVLSLDQGSLISNPNENNFADTHSLVLLVDSLSLMAALEALDPTVTPEIARQFYGAMSNAAALTLRPTQGKAEGDTLERILDAFYRLLRGPIAPPSLLDYESSLNGNTWHLEAFRVPFHERLKDLNTAVANLRSGFGAPAYSIRSLTTHSVADLVTSASGDDATGKAYRYALKELNPFAVVGNDDLYAPHNIRGELDLYDAATRGGTLTDDWIRDRATFLAWKNIAYANNGTGVQNVQSTESWRFLDLPQANLVTISPALAGAASLGVSHWAIFGGDRADAVVGGTRVDRLYGGGGADWLESRGGDDYLEGGAGPDVYNYNAFRELFGINSGNDGAETIRDADGRGVLRYVFRQGVLSNPQSTVIADASIKLSDTQWRSADGRFTYTKTPDSEGRTDLVVTINDDAGGSLTLKDFRDGDLAIRLWEARPTPLTGNTIIGDMKPKDFDPAAPGVQVQFDAIGNVIVTSEPEADRSDFLLGDRPTLTDPDMPGDAIVAGGGNNIIWSDRPNHQPDNGLGNADWIVAGSGSDWIDAGAGNDLIEAGEISIAGFESGDIVDAGTGSDEIYAGTRIALADAINQSNTAIDTGVKGDFLSGGAGDDWIVGAAANDALLGGGDGDLIVGGAGDDTIWGDLGYTTNTLSWTVTRTVTPENGFAIYKAILSDVVNVPTPGAADVVYAGGGADWVFGDVGDDFIDGGSGDDVLFGEAESDILIGGAGHDLLVGDNPGNLATGSATGSDYLEGGEGNDTLQGDGGDDILVGGPGTDLLKGLAGKDIYVYNRGDGEDIVIDDTPSGADHPEASVLVTGEGISRDSVKFRKGSLLVDFGPADETDPESPRDRIHFLGFDPLNPHVTPVLGEIRFADGDSMTYADMLAQGFDIDGTDGDDNGVGLPLLEGTAVTDRIQGFGGDDFLVGLTGDDVLDGGAGDDLLQGGEGSDALIGGSGENILEGGEGADLYVFNASDGLTASDLIDDLVGQNAIEFGAGIDVADLAVSSYVSDDGNPYLEIAYGDDRTVKIRDGLLGTVSGFTFADGTARDLGELLHDAGPLGIFGNDQANTLFGSAVADVIEGQGGDDEIRSGEGDDELIGGIGNDTLHGGAGDDRYELAWGAGTDTAIDADGGVITLGAGLARDDVFAESRGTDLFVGIRYADSGILIKDFEPGSWQLEDEGGHRVAMNDLPPAVPPGLSHEVLFSRALAQARAELINGLSARGYRSLNPDHLRRDLILAPGGIHTHEYHAHLRVESRNTDDAEIFRVSPPTFEQLTAFSSTLRLVQGYEVRRGGRDGGLHAGSGGGSQPRFVPVGSPGGISGVQYDPATQVLVPVKVDGQITGFWIHNNGSGGGGGGGGDVVTPFLYNVEDRYFQYRTDYVIETISGGASDNTINISTDLEVASIASAGGGNDRIHSEFGLGWAAKNTDYGFLNNSFVFVPGNFMDGGDGDDYLSGGVGEDELFGGPGDDWFDGGGGGDVYEILVDEAGYDTIVDDGGAATLYGGRTGLHNDELFHHDAYYRSIGLPNWMDLPPEALPPVPATNDFAAWEPFYNQRIPEEFSQRVVIRPDTVKFLGALSAADLHLSWGRVNRESTYVTLDIEWGENRGVRVVIPHADDTVGAGIEYFQFADGTRLTMREMIERAPPAAPSFDPQHEAATGGPDRIEGNDADDTLDLGDGDDLAQGLGGGDVIKGGAGNDELRGEGLRFVDLKYGASEAPSPGNGNDILIGGAGNDILAGDGGRNVLDGGAGDDLLRGNSLQFMNSSSGNFVAGGAGNDEFAPADSGLPNIIAFNRGDGQDTIRSTFDPVVISLGGGIRDGDLALSRSGQDLILSAGAGDAIVFDSWYDHSPSTVKLQIIDSAVAVYDFSALTTRFDQLRVADSTFTNWRVQGDLTDHHVGSSTDTAFGGTLAYAYAITGSLDGLATGQILDVLRDPNFGHIAQPFDPSGAVNHAPALVHALSNQSIAAGTMFSYTIPLDAFADIDAGDILNYAAFRTDGSVLPAWLAFDPQTRSFAGTPTAGDVGVIAVGVTAADSHGSTVRDVFDLMVTSAPASDGRGDTGTPRTPTDETAGEPADDGTLAGIAAPSGPEIAISDEAAANEGDSVGTPAGISGDAAGNGGAIAESGGSTEGEQQVQLVDSLDAFLAQLSGSGLVQAALEAQRSGGGDQTLTAQEIADSWRAADQFVKSLAEESVDARGGAAIDWQLEQALLGVSEFGAGVGPGGLPGIGQGAANLQTLAGLAEGFQRL